MIFRQLAPTASAVGVFILDNRGFIVVKYKYDAWGNHKILSADGVEITDEAHLGYLNPHRYRGYYYSDEMGLYYLKSRFYDPSIGRFISADSIDYLDPHTVGGLNLFAYCNNNPVMNVDPTGCWSWSAFWKGIATLVVAASAIAVSVATIGAATPLAVTAIAAVTATAGALTAVNGVATVVEAATDYNFVEEAVFQGNEAAYETYAAVTESVASVGAAVLGVYNATGYAKAARAGRQFLGKGYAKARSNRWVSGDGLRQMIADTSHHVLDGMPTTNHFNLIEHASNIRLGHSNIAKKIHVFYKGFKVWFR